MKKKAQISCSTWTTIITISMGFMLTGIIVTICGVGIWIVAGDAVLCGIGGILLTIGLCIAFISSVFS